MQVSEGHIQTRPHEEESGELTGFIYLPVKYLTPSLVHHLSSRTKPSCGSYTEMQICYIVKVSLSHPVCSFHTGKNTQWDPLHPRRGRDPKMQPRQSLSRAHTDPHQPHFRGGLRVLAAPVVCPALPLLSWCLWVEEAPDHWPQAGCSTRGRASKTDHSAFIVQSKLCCFPFPLCTTGEGMGDEEWGGTQGK